MSENTESQELEEARASRNPQTAPQIGLHEANMRALQARAARPAPDQSLEVRLALEDTQRRAQGALVGARQQAKTIVREAEEQAAEIVAGAQAQARAVREAANAEAEQVVAEAVRQVANAPAPGPEQNSDPEPEPEVSTDPGQSLGDPEQ